MTLASKSMICDGSLKKRSARQLIKVLKVLEVEGAAL